MLLPSIGTWQGKETAWIESWSLPELSMKASGLPKPSTKVWIFVFLPPLDTPMALFSGFFPAIGTLMHLTGCRVDGDIFKIPVYSESLENCVKNPCISPLPKAGIYCLPRTAPLRKFSPRRPTSGFHNIPFNAVRLSYFAGRPRFLSFGCSGGSISLIRFHSLSVNSPFHRP